MGAVIERMRVIPHGVEAVFRPLTIKEKESVRKEAFRDRVKPNDFLIVNVNTNQRRKGVAQSLQVLRHLVDIRAAELRDKGETHLPQFRMYLHMPAENTEEQISMPLVARQLGLKEGTDIFYGRENFHMGRPKLTDEALNQVYNMADLYLTTSLGEGWGLGVTEAMAAGVVVAAPGHTSLAELLDDGNRGIVLPIGQADVVSGDNSRLRPRVDAVEAALAIIEWIEGCGKEDQRKRASDWVSTLGWDFIANELLEAVVGDSF